MIGSTRTRWVPLISAAIACGATVCPGAALAQSTTPATSAAPTAAGVLVVQMPFTGDAAPDLLQIAEDSTRNAVLARGATGPDRSTVRNAMPVSPPSDTAGIVAFGRSMGATHVLTGRITPLTGQYNLELHLYDVATSRMATQQRNIGDGEESTVVPQMLEGLFAPGAMQASPEEQARLDAERRQREEDAARQQREAAERRAREAQAALDAERRRREEAERNRRVYRLDEGGPWSIGAGLAFGGRFTPVVRPPGQPRAPSFLSAMRIEGLYGVLPAYGLEVGATANLIFTPTSAFGIGATVRFWLPWHAYLPLRAGVGVTGGLFQGLTGARATAGWLSFDVRGEYDVSPLFTIWAGAVLDSIPGLYGSMAGMVGLRFHFGADTPASNATGSTGTPAATTQSSDTGDGPIVAP